MVGELMVNYWTVLVTSIVGIIIGSLWYGPIFGKQWMKLSGIKMPKTITPQIKKEMRRSYLIMFVSLLITNFVLGQMIKYNGLTDFVSAASLAFFIWLGFYAPVMVGAVIWEGKPWKLYFINITHYLVALIVSSYILAIW